MNIGTIEGFTRVLGAPKDWDHSKGACEGLPVLDVATDQGPVMVSAWLPSPEDLKALQAGMPILLMIYGKAHPVVSVAVQREP
ncbi:hypothetical protein [Cupriavidus sp. DL-D2]|uniref:hypothetical protein n=1 Tax=Cupriavidus sp. DL-D2 TaxID=3144974 RepID=UPI0032148517